ncbi:MAG: hypothetical protein KGY61_10300 [Desulfobacterales bacterium]|nr:hypothetical protein [Desulfobacterales bacterium]
MRQKYEMIKDKALKKLKIREYAVIDKRLKNVSTSMLLPEDYALLHEETYDSKHIQSAISNGMIDLVSTLRTPVFFPDANHIAMIAESVIKLYDAKGRNTVELILGNGGEPTAKADA